MAGFARAERNQLIDAIKKEKVAGTPWGQTILNLNAAGFRTPGGDLINTKFLKHFISYHTAQGRFGELAKKVGMSRAVTVEANGVSAGVIDKAFLAGVVESAAFSDAQKVGIIRGAISA